MANTEKGKSRGNGPIAIFFIDDQNKQHKRVPAKVTGIGVVDTATGKSKSFNLADLSDDVICQGAAFGFAGRVLTYARNTIKNNAGASVLSCADSVMENLKSGKMYTRAEGNGAGPQGRPFDYDIWREVMASVASAKGVKISDKQLENFVVGLKALTPKERQADIKKRQGDPYVVAALKHAQAKRTQQAIKKGAADTSYDALADF
jgi:hypothetical protein